MKRSDSNATNIAGLVKPHVPEGFELKYFGVLEMVKAFEEASGKKIPYKVVARRAGDLGSVICNPALAEKELGWVATRDMKTVMEDSWRWQSENPYGYDKEAPEKD
ncbi:udp-glucose 4-epimerase, putative [Perkinsus marinus ATCC 50983]|uniref:UDP-glucose 4-epimerase n=1 Tax=Perkinsus marinus (strain ATCC 50983 / TXsc) TaxID=423536 RepID=C5LVH0_PERM5|nr:udp-glucose 4-epimerase, putative [Perkinsus marinus ATCC 50983]EEQ99257.1 udp-glucose 4-epimerase, putative [Perkinsus marinus ATCC 50983]|eukprot:XP_002766540.1 udp-glucose 4-epimerase, putative [Perkinsus marinus ATCC 50983]